MQIRLEIVSLPQLWSLIYTSNDLLTYQTDLLSAVPVVFTILWYSNTGTVIYQQNSFDQCMYVEHCGTGITM